MNRSMWIAGCGVYTLLLTPIFAAAQEADDLFGEPAEGAVDNPFQERNAADVSRAIDRSLIAPADGQPAQGQAHVATPDDDNDFCQCIGEGDPAAVARIEQALRGKLKSQGLDFSDTALEEVVGFIQETYQIPVQLDTTALEEIGVDPQEPVTVNLHGISLRSALRLVLKNLNLTYIIRDEVLMITTPEAAESELVTCVYDVRDLLSSGGDFDSLIDMVVSCISTQTWAEKGGGEAQIRPLQPGLLVISQTQAVHEQIRALLQAIRNAHKQGPAAAGDAEKSAAASADPNQLTTRAYVLSIGQPAAPLELQAKVKELITTAFPDEKWVGRLPDGQPVLLTVLPDRVVLRHSSDVHDKVQKLLNESGVASTPAVGMAGPGGGFGGGGGGGGFFQPDPK